MDPIEEIQKEVHHTVQNSKLAADAAANEVAEKAEDRMSKMSKQYPTIDEVFALGLQAGGNFTVKNVAGCPCSGESTIIRVR